MSNDGTVLELFVARHGESTRNVAFRAGISRDNFTVKENEDPPLTETGLFQARLLGERLSVGELSAVFSSPLSRALSTADEIVKKQPSPLPIEIIPNLVETNIHPDFAPDGMETLRRAFPRAKLYRDSPESDIKEIPVGERGAEHHLSRAKEVVDYFRSRFSCGEKIIAVAHGGFNTFLIAAALGFCSPLHFGFCQHNTSLSKIKFYPDGRCRVAFINDTSHLYEHDSKIAYNE